MCVSALSACISMHDMCAWYLQKPKVLYSLKLELQIVVSHHVLGTEPISSGRATSVLNL